MLTNEEINILERIYNDKIVKVEKYIDKRDNRHVSRIFFINKKPIGRYTAAWRLEVKLNRKLNTSRTGGCETVDHIDNDCTNDNIYNLQLLSSYDNLFKSNVINKKSIGENNGRSILTNNDVLNILNLYYYNNKSITDISLLYKNITYNGIRLILTRKNWKNIPFKIPENFIKPTSIGKYNHKGVISNSKLNVNDVLNILNLYYYNNKSITDISLLYKNITYENIILIVHRKIWKSVQFIIPDNFIKPNSIGRHSPGEGNGNSKLNNKNIISMKLERKILNFSNETLIKKYNISKSTLNKILNNKSWNHVQVPDIFNVTIYGKQFFIIINQIIIINNIHYKFIGKYIDNIYPKYNCIYINIDNKLIKVLYEDVAL